MRPFELVAVVLIAQTMAGCSGSSIAGPAPSNLSKPVISAISPDTGSTYGGSWLHIYGTFDRNATLTIGGISAIGGWSPTDPTLHFLYSPPHAAGPVNVVVTNPNSGTQTVVGGYTYVDPAAFDLNGAWSGVTVDGSDTLVAFTVRENVLTSVRCADWSNTLVEIPVSAPVVNGKVEFAGHAGRFSAWVASATEAAGTIDMTPCPGVLRWQTERTRP